MEFEWDEIKSNRTFKERGFDFNYATRVFSDPQLIERIDKRKNYGEIRRQCIGQVDDGVYFVAYTIRRNVIRIISARKAHDNEQEQYWSSLESRSPDW
jgi:uncharacterized DUF497 family protein